MPEKDRAAKRRPPGRFARPALLLTVAKGSALWKPDVWKGIAMQFPEYGVITLGLMFCFICGKIDMSFVVLGDFATIMAVKYMIAHTTPEMGDGQVGVVILVGILIALLIEAGVDAIHPIQAKAAGMQPDNLKKLFYGKVAFCGGVDTQDLLPFGTPEDVAAKVRELRTIFPTGLIVSPSHEALQADVPPENVKALFDEADKIY